MNSSGKSVDVIIGSPRDSFWETVQVILRGYYPYKLLQFQTVDKLLDYNESEFTPVLALIDGQDGSAATNEWVQSTKMNFPNCKLIVLHSAATSLDFGAVKKNGADEIMHISFDREFISDMVLQLAPIDMEGDHIPITALMPVDLRDIEVSLDINFDIYIHLPANHRSLLMYKAGAQVGLRQIEKFQNSHRQMYIKKTQMKAFFEYARTVMSLRNIPFPVSMTEKFHRSKKAIYEIMAVFLNGSNTDFQEGKKIYESCKNILGDLELTKELQGPALFDEAFRYTGNARTPYHDCICLSAYASFFAQALGWKSDVCEGAAIAGLLHNIGTSTLPISLTEKNSEKMTAEERAEYYQYPERSINLVKAKKVPLAPEIARAISEHRENPKGTGFPNKLTSTDISDLGRLLAFAYCFHELTSLKDERQALTPEMALEQLENDAVSGQGKVDLIIATSLSKKWKSSKIAA